MFEGRRLAAAFPEQRHPSDGRDTAPSSSICLMVLFDGRTNDDQTGAQRSRRCKLGVCLPKMVGAPAATFQVRREEGT